MYLPNYNYTYNSGQSTEKVQYSATESAAMISNGGQVGTKGGDQGWPLCLACAVVKKTGQALPGGCAACFSTYCYN